MKKERKITHTIRRRAAAPSAGRAAMSRFPLRMLRESYWAMLRTTGPVGCGKSPVVCRCSIKETEMDEYKVKQLRQMLAHETSGCEEHFGARLSHWCGDTRTLTIDAGGLKALIAYYEQHDTDLGGISDE